MASAHERAGPLSPAAGVEGIKWGGAGVLRSRRIARSGPWSGFFRSPPLYSGEVRDRAGLARRDDRRALDAPSPQPAPEPDQMARVGVEQDEIAVGDRGAGPVGADDRRDASLPRLRRDV